MKVLSPARTSVATSVPRSARPNVRSKNPPCLDASVAISASTHPGDGHRVAASIAGVPLRVPPADHRASAATLGSAPGGTSVGAVSPLLILADRRRQGVD